MVSRDLFIKEINEILKESFILDINQELPTIDVLFIDTDIDENYQGELFYDEISQDTSAKLSVDKLNNY